MARRRLQHLNPAGVRDKLAMSRHGADAVSGLYLARVKVNKVRSRAPTKGPGLPPRLHYSNISGNGGGALQSDSADGSSGGYDGSRAALFIGESDPGLTVHNRGAARGTGFILARISADYYERRSEDACQA